MRTVLKGWLLVEGRKPVRVIQETRGAYIFVRGGGGWRRIHGNEMVVLLPRRILKAEWRHEQWWRSLWASPEWAWIYGAP